MMNSIIRIAMVACGLFFSLSLRAQNQTDAAVSAGTTVEPTASTGNAASGEATSVAPAPTAPAPTAASAATQPSTIQPAPAAVQPATATAPPPPVNDYYLMERERRLQERERIREERLEARRIAKLSGRPLIISGAIALGVGYIVSFTVGGVLAFDANEDGAAFMLIPFVGNPIYMAILLGEEADRRAEDEYYSERPMFFISLALLIPTIAQVTGLSLLIAGLVKRSRYKKQQTPAVSVAPFVSPDVRGLSLSMAF